MFNSNLSLFAKTLTLTSALFFLSSCAQEEPVYEAFQENNSVNENATVSPSTRGNKITFSNYDGIKLNGSSNSSLSDIADSYEYFLHPSGSPDSHEITYSVGNYRDPGKSGSVVGGLIVRLWNVYSIPKRTNYYLIHIESQSMFANAYKGIYNKAVETDGCYTIAKVAEWYGRKVKIQISKSRGSFYTESHFPNTTSSSVNYSTTVGQSYGTCIGKKGDDFNLEFRPSFTFTDGQSYSVQDVTVHDYSTTDNNLSWEFNINNEPKASFHPFYVAGSDFTEPCATAVSSLTARTDAEIAFPYDANNPPRLKVSYQIILASSCAKCGGTCGYRTASFPDNRMETIEFDLPYITPEQAEAAQKKAK